MSAIANTTPVRRASPVGEKRSPLAERKNDLYETPIEAVRALLAAERLPTGIWEPACGRGAIVRPLRAAGHVVYATDLVDYETPDQDAAGWDFLLERQMPIGASAIVTNPPFKIADEFVAHALRVATKVVMLLRLAFLESERRRPILEGAGLARVHVFRNRLPMMHRDGWGGPRATSRTPFAWFVWEAGHRGAPVLNRISWERDNGLLA